MFRFCTLVPFLRVLALRSRIWKSPRNILSNDVSPLVKKHRRKSKFCQHLFSIRQNTVRLHAATMKRMLTLNDTLRCVFRFAIVRFISEKHNKIIHQKRGYCQVFFFFKNVHLQDKNALIAPPTPIAAAIRNNQSINVFL